MSAAVYILGGAQSDFARNLSREGAALSDVARDVIHEALQDASLDAGELQSVHVGNAFGELFQGQAQLGALPATVIPPLWGLPAARHEAACASGSVAILAAMAEIEAGRYDCVLVLGLEQERNVPGELAARHLGAAAWVGHEGQEARYMWPHMFARIADAYDTRWGLASEHLAAIAEKNLTHAQRNPNAQARGWSFGPRDFGADWEDDARNPPVEGRLRRLDCGQISDGSVAVVLASASFAKAHAMRRGMALEHLPRVLSWGHRTAGLGLEEKLRRSATSEYLFPHLRQAVTDAYRRARLAGPEDLDGVELHDCFTVTEYMLIDHLGVTAPGQAYRAIESGQLRFGGTLPVNPSGGLIGAGHPVGATGVRMLLDASRQVTGRAGDMQVQGARRFATLNVGGSATTAVALIVGTDGEGRIHAHT